jgi:hypothetical protein
MKAVLTALLLDNAPMASFVTLRLRQLHQKDIASNKLNAQ